MENYILCEVLGNENYFKSLLKLTICHSPNTVVCLDGSIPIKYGLRLNTEAKYLELKEEMQKLCGIAIDRLLLAEVSCSQVCKVLKDGARINPNTATKLYVYELPEIKHVDKTQQNKDIELGYTMHINEKRTFCFIITFFSVLVILEVDMAVSQSPLARSPEVRGGSALCMPNILCFKVRTHLKKSFPCYP